MGFLNFLVFICFLVGLVFVVIWRVGMAFICWRNWIFVMLLWCWRRLLRVPWTARRSNQPILKEINPELEGLLLKLKLQYFGHLIWRVNSLERNLMLGKTEGKRRRGQHRMIQLDCINNSMAMNVSKLQDIVEDTMSLVCCSPWSSKESDMT